MTDNTEPRYHSLKCWPEPFQAILEGRKRFEYRKDDRGFAVGDKLRLKEWDPGILRRPSSSYSIGIDGDYGEYTGREMFVEVTYRLGSEFGVPDGYCVLSLGEVEDQ